MDQQTTKRHLATLLGNRNPIELTNIVPVEPTVYNEVYNDWCENTGKNPSAGSCEAWILHSLAKKLVGENVTPKISVALEGIANPVSIDIFNITHDEKVQALARLVKDDDYYTPALHALQNAQSAPERFYFFMYVHKDITSENVRNFYAMLKSNLQVNEVTQVVKWISIAYGHLEPDRAALAVAERHPWLQYRMNVASAGKLVLEAMTSIPQQFVRAMLGNSLNRVFLAAKAASEKPHDMKLHHAIPQEGIAFAYVALAAVGKQYGEFHSGKKAAGSLPTATIRRWKIVLTTHVSLIDASLSALPNEDANQYMTRVSNMI